MNRTFSSLLAGLIVLGFAIGVITLVSSGKQPTAQQLTNASLLQVEQTMQSQTKEIESLRAQTQKDKTLLLASALEKKELQQTVEYWRSQYATERELRLEGDKAVYRRLALWAIGIVVVVGIILMLAGNIRKGGRHLRHHVRKPKAPAEEVGTGGHRAIEQGGLPVRT